MPRTAFSIHQELLFVPVSTLLRKCNGPIIARALARENANEQVTAGCLLIGWEKCARIFSQSRSSVRNQSRLKITDDARLKTAIVIKWVLEVPWRNPTWTCIWLHQIILNSVFLFLCNLFYLRAHWTEQWLWHVLSKHFKLKHTRSYIVS